MDHAHLDAVLGRHSLADQVVQPDQPVGQRDGAQGRPGMAVYEPVGVGAGQGDDERPARVLIGKPRDRVRAAPGVQRDHEVGGPAVVVD